MAKHGVAAAAMAALRWWCSMMQLRWWVSGTYLIHSPHTHYPVIPILIHSHCVCYYWLPVFTILFHSADTIIVMMLRWCRRTVLMMMMFHYLTRLPTTLLLMVSDDYPWCHRYGIGIPLQYICPITYSWKMMKWYDDDIFFLPVMLFGDDDPVLRRWWPWWWLIWRYYSVCVWWCTFCLHSYYPPHFDI